MTTGSRKTQLQYRGTLGVYNPKTHDEILERSPEETRRSPVQIGAAPPPELLNVLLNLQNDAKSQYTIKGVRKNLTRISKFADLNRPEQVKNYIANMNVSNAYKHIICTHYDIYCKYNKIEWKKPRYKQDNRAIQLPHTEKVEALIHGAKSPLCIKLGLSAKTGLRPIELYSLQVKHIDLTKRQIYPATAKNGLARVLTVDQTLTDQLATYIQKNNLTLTDKLFKRNQQEYYNAFRRYRNRMANKLKDPSLKLIRLYDLRHYFCSMLFAKTNSLPYVSQQMGHKHIDTTMRYTHLIASSNEYTSDVATTPEQARKLIDSGFEYVQTIDNTHIYRKRKILF